MIRRGGFFASVGALANARGLALASQILVLPILARHLTPAEFGIAALATGVALFTTMLSDGGMGRSLVRTPLSERDEWSSVFWAMAALGVLLAGALLAVTPAIVWLFADPALFWPLAALAPLPFILALNAASAAEMEQRGAFPEIALGEAIATLIALGVAVLLAVTGFGVWALIVQQLLQVGLKAVWIARRTRFRPTLRFSRRALATHLVFGRDTLAGSLLGFLREQVTTLVIGKVLGVGALGIFAMTQRFSRLPMYGLAGPFGQVLYVRLTGVRGDLAVFRAVLLASIRLLGLVILPPVAALAVAGETAFTLLLSDRWAAVAPIFVLIVGHTTLNAVTNPTFVALNALGETGARLRLVLEITLLWLAMLAAAVPFGLEAVAAARTIWMVVQVPRHWAYLRRTCGITARGFVAALLPGLAGAAAVGAILGVVVWLADPVGWVWVGWAAGAGLVAVAGTGLVLGRLVRADLRLLRGGTDQRDV